MNRRFLKRLAKSIGLGVIDAAKTTVAAPVVTAIESTKANMKATEGGEGKVDWIRLAVFVCSVVGVLAFIFGKIDIDQLKQLIKLIGRI